MNDDPRMPPIDEDAERGVLAAVLVDNAAFDVAAEFLTGTEFSSTKHLQIWRRMRDLRLAGEAIDLVTLSAELEAEGALDLVGGRAYVADLSLAVGSASQVATHAQLVRRTKLQRDLIRLGMELTESGYAKELPEAIIERFTRRVFEIGWGRSASPWQKLDAVAMEAFNYVEAAMKRGSELIGWTTGLVDLDAMLGGLQKSDLVVIGARPSMGKTALACGIALSAAAAGAKVGIVSLEMSRLQLGLRFLAYEGRVDVSALRTGRMRPDQWRRTANAAVELTSRMVWIDDSGFMTMDQIRAKARQLASRDGLDVLVLDYLQLLNGEDSRDGRARELAAITRQLKLLAKELDVTVIALSQLSRELERREDKRPILSDLRESGAIEQDADIVLFIYRDEVYAENVNPGTAELLLRKHRNGPVGMVAVAFQEQFARFENLSRETAPEAQT